MQLLLFLINFSFSKLAVFDFVNLLQRLSTGTNVIQLETACGAGMKNFSNAIGKLTGL